MFFKHWVNLLKNTVLSRTGKKRKHKRSLADPILTTPNNHTLGM